jgi:hypothetical protein
MDVYREFEVRLFDGDQNLVLIAPIVATSEDLAHERAAALAKREQAHGFSVHGQMRSVNYRNIPTQAKT